MSQQSAHSTSAAFGMSGTYGTLQIGVVDHALVLQTIGRNYDTAGFLHIDAAQVRLPIAEAYRLHEALGRAIIEAESVDDTRQPGLWSNATITAQASRISGRRSA
jgi:hypothetical protein